MMWTTVFRPPGAGPFPLAVINHGSTQNELRRAGYAAPQYTALTEWLVAHGYAVAVPQRPGHGKTGGTYYEDQGGCANADFRKASSDAQAHLYKEAGDAFAAVAEHMTGMGKQDALWNAVRAYQAAGLPDETNSAIDALLTAFPKSFYFAPAQTIRARVFIAKGDLEGAKKAFAAIAAEKGMNPRDAYRERPRDPAHPVPAIVVAFPEQVVLLVHVLVEREDRRGDSRCAHDEGRNA